MRLERKRRVLTALLKPMLFVGCATAIMAQPFIVFDAPNALWTSATSINNSRDVAGSFYDTIQSKTRGYIRDRSGNFTVFDIPNQAITEVLSMNGSGDVTGYFSSTDPGGLFHGFVRDQSGNITTFDAPNADNETIPVRINDSGAVTGFLPGHGRSTWFCCLRR
jgi:hypothetical protein